MFCLAICGHKDCVVGQIGLVGPEGLRSLPRGENWHLLHWDVNLARQLGTSTLGGYQWGILTVKRTIGTTATGGAARDGTESRALTRRAMSIASRVRCRSSTVSLATARNGYGVFCRTV